MMRNTILFILNMLKEREDTRFSHQALHGSSLLDF